MFAQRTGTSDSRQAIFIVSNTASITGLTIEHGYADPAASNLSFKNSDGTTTYATAAGGIYNHGQLALSRVVIVSNMATAAGGGIENDGTLTIDASQITGNTTPVSGGGLNNEQGGTVTIHDSTIANNQSGIDGGGLSNDGTLTVDASQITGNQAATNGGGLNNNQAGTVTIQGSVIEDNQSKTAGGIENSGIVNIDRCRVTTNVASDSGASAIANDGTLMLSDSSIFKNRVTENFGNSAILNTKVMTIGNSTIAVNRGGGIYNSGTSAIISNSTITGNQAREVGAGITNITGFAAVNGNIAVFPYAASKLTLMSDVIVNNMLTAKTGTLAPDLAGLATSLGYNLIGDDGGTSKLVNGKNHDQIGASIVAQIGTLTDNGGFAPTVALQTGSPAINAGFCGGNIATNPPIAAATTDERGVPRKVTCDIGAYESGTSVPTNTPTSVATPTVSVTLAVATQ